MEKLRKISHKSVLPMELIEYLIDSRENVNTNIQPKLTWDSNCAVVKEVVKVNRFTKNHEDVENDLNAFLSHFHYAPKCTFEIDDSSDILQTALDFSLSMKKSEIDLIIYHSNQLPTRIMGGHFFEYVLKYYPSKEIIIIPFRMALLKDNESVEITRAMWEYDLNYFVRN